MSHAEKRTWFIIGVVLFVVLIGVVLYNAFPAPTCLYDLHSGAWVCGG